MQFFISIVPFLLMIAIFYVIILVPENRRKKKYSAMLSSVKVNDEILTRGGLIGKIVNVQEKFVILETGPDRARVKLDKNGISQILTEKVEENKENKDNKDNKEIKEK